MKHIIMTAAFALLSSTAMADELRYQAVWHSGAGTNILTGPESRDKFIATGAAQTQQGRRLIDVETALVDGRRIYTGLWVGGSGSNLFDGPVGPIELRGIINAREAQGLRIVDFEVLRSAEGGRRYLAVWRPGTGRQVLTGPMEEAAFLARGQRLVEKEGLRLIDVELERRQGVLLYYGLFRTGSGSNFITTPLRANAFRAKREEMRQNGLELVDLEVIGMGARERYVGVWASGDGEGQISAPRLFPQFVTFGQQHTAAGFRTEDIELRVRRTQPLPEPEPGDDPSGGGGGDDTPSTADLPDPPDWVTIDTSGNPNIVLRLGNQALNDRGYHLTIHHSLLPENLPMDEDFNKIFPDNICGLRMFQPSSSFWEDAQGNLIADDHHHNHQDYSGEILETHALQGIDFTGPMGACEAANEAWQFPEPLSDGNHMAAENSLRLIVEFPERVEFLNFNTHPGGHLEMHELFGEKIRELLGEIAKTFAETQIDNGYCDGVQGYMVEVCDANPGLCPVEDPQGNC